MQKQQPEPPQQGDGGAEVAYGALATAKAGDDGAGVGFEIQETSGGSGSKISAEREDEKKEKEKEKEEEKNILAGEEPNHKKKKRKGKVKSSPELEDETGSDDTTSGESATEQPTRESKSARKRTSRAKALSSDSDEDDEEEDSRKNRKKKDRDAKSRKEKQADKEEEDDVHSKRSSRSSSRRSNKDKKSNKKRDQSQQQKKNKKTEKMKKKPGKTKKAGKCCSLLVQLLYVFAIGGIGASLASAPVAVLTRELKNQFVVHVARSTVEGFVARIGDGVRWTLACILPSHFNSSLSTETSVVTSSSSTSTMKYVQWKMGNGGEEWPLDGSDVIISLSSLKNLSMETQNDFKGWRVSFKNHSEWQEVGEVEGAYVAPIGRYNRGKTWVLNTLCKISLPHGFAEHTKGISIKLPHTGRGRNLVLLDTAGMQSPVAVSALLDRKCTDSFIQQLIFELSNTVLYVVNELTLDDQKYLNLLLQSKMKAKKLLVVHNLRDVTGLADMEKSIIRDIVVPFGGVKREGLVGGDEEAIYYYSKHFGTRHYIFAQEGSEAAEVYNARTAQLLLATLRNEAQTWFKVKDVIPQIIKFSEAFLSDYFVTAQPRKIMIDASRGFEEKIDPSTALTPFVVYYLRKAFDYVAGSMTPGTNGQPAIPGRRVEIPASSPTPVTAAVVHPQFANPNFSLVLQPESENTFRILLEHPQKLTYAPRLRFGELSMLDIGHNSHNDFRPLVNLAYNDTHYVVHVDLPGVSSPAGIVVRLDKLQELTVSGPRANPFEEEGRHYSFILQQSFFSDHFETALCLPTPAREIVEKSLANGVLQVVLLRP